MDGRADTLAVRVNSCHSSPATAVFAPPTVACVLNAVLQWMLCVSLFACVWSVSCVSPFFVPGAEMPCPLECYFVKNHVARPSLLSERYQSGVRIYAVVLCSGDQRVFLTACKDQDGDMGTGKGEEG